VAFSFEDLTPEAKKAAFAHMDAKRLGRGGRHKKLSARQKSAVEHGGRGKVSGKLGSGSVKGRLSPADHDRGSVGGKLPIAKARSATRKPATAPKAAEPDTPEGRFDKDFTDFMHNLADTRLSEYASMTEIRKELDARGMSRAEQDAHLKRMSGEQKLHIVPEDNRKALTQEDRDAAIHIGGEPNHIVSLADFPDRQHAKFQASAKPEDRYTGPEDVSPPSIAELAKEFVELHGHQNVAPRIAYLEKKKRLLRGERAQLAALKSLNDSGSKSGGSGGISEAERTKLEAFVSKRQAQAATSPDDRYTAGAKNDAAKNDAITLKQYGGPEGVASRIARLERRKNLAAGERAQLAMLRSLLKNK